MIDAQQLDDFCADGIRAMRRLRSFNPIRDNGVTQHGRQKAALSFARKLHKAFPELTNKEVHRLRRWAQMRARGWSFVATAREALSRPSD